MREAPPLTERLRARLLAGTGVRALSVTDLGDERRAFWRRSGGPAPPPPERQEKMELGRAWHLRLGTLFAKEGRLEVRVRRDGISARIDLLAELPVEIKTGTQAISGDLLAERPEWVEQVAMYCALLGRSEGRCLYVPHTDKGAGPVRVFDLGFRDPARLRAELEQRARRLRDALVSNRPAPLPRCRWFDRGCEFQTARICDCSGREPEPARGFGEELSFVEERPEIEERCDAALGQATFPPVSPVGRFRDLVYPRRAYFERTMGVPPPGPPPSPVGAPELYERLSEALESGPVGEVARVVPLRAGPEEEVVGWEGDPYLLRTSRAWDRVRPDELFDRFPQYVVELGFRCAVTGVSRGRVIVGYERAERDEDRVQVLEVEFDPLEPWERRCEDRSLALAASLGSGEFATLPACPAWMYPDCPYRGSCACATEPPRSQR